MTGTISEKALTRAMWCMTVPGTVVGGGDVNITHVSVTQATVGGAVR